MVGQFRLQRSLQDCFRELFQKAVLADDVFRLLVIGQQLINECLVDGHRFPFSSSDGRLHSPFYTLPLPDDEIKDILPWIPPRAVCHVDVASIVSTKIGGAKARGLYIDSFIPPDRLEAAYVHENRARVRGAAACAIKAGAKIVSLGGFSSILIEGNFDQLPERHDTVFTTGNTLTVAFIVQAIKR